MKKSKMMVSALLVSVMLTACGTTQETTEKGVNSGTAVTAAQEESKQEDKKVENSAGGKELSAEEIKARVTKRTYVNPNPKGQYIIDFVEYPGWDSGYGKCERTPHDLDKMEDGYTYLAVANFYPGSTDFNKPELSLDNIKQVTDIPVVLAEPISYNFREATCYDLNTVLSILQYDGTEYSSIEDIGELNGYEWCRYEGVCNYSWANEQAYQFKIVGYATFLKNTGNPIYISAMDAREDQSQVDVDKLDELAYNCAMTLYEVDEEVMNELPWS